MAPLGGNWQRGNVGRIGTTTMPDEIAQGQPKDAPTFVNGMNFAGNA
jgi:hypothetical protein